MVSNLKPQPNPNNGPELTLPKKWPEATANAERAGLGAVLLSGDFVSASAVIPSAEVFHFLSHRTIWQAMEEMSNAQPPKAIDVSTVGEWLEAAGLLADLGGEVPQKDAPLRGADYLALLLSSAAVADNALDYLLTIVRAAGIRELLTIGPRITQTVLAAERGDSLAAIGERVDRIVMEATAPASGGRVMIIGDALDEYDREQDARQGQIYRATGLRCVDNFMGGWESDVVNLVSGPPGSGKTAMILQTALYSARHALPVLFSSQEMTRGQVVERLLSMMSKVPSENIRNNKLDEEEADNVADARRELAQIPLFIDDTRRISIPQLRMKARRIAAHFGLAGIYQDYYQKILRLPAPGANLGDVMEMLAEELRGLAEEFHCPVVCGGQINEKSIQNKQDKRPGPDDLRNGPAPYEVAGVAVFLYRGALYGDPIPVPDEAEFIIRKRRSGAAQHTEFLRFRSRYTLFVDPHDIPF